jgi:hypothetical protein
LGAGPKLGISSATASGGETIADDKVTGAGGRLPPAHSAAAHITRPRFEHEGREKDQMAIAPTHRFKIGQTVALVPSTAGRAMPTGQYVVTRLMPPTGGGPHYRAKSVAQGTEWALVEAQMHPVAAPVLPANPPEASVSH